MKNVPHSLRSLSLRTIVGFGIDSGSMFGFPLTGLSRSMGGQLNSTQPNSTQLRSPQLNWAHLNSIELTSTQLSSPQLSSPHTLFVRAVLESVCLPLPGYLRSICWTEVEQQEFRQLSTSQRSCLIADPLLIWTHPYRWQSTHTIYTVLRTGNVRYRQCVNCHV